MSEVTGLACGACGVLSAPGSRFCASCGQPLVTRGDERRIVTVLFADLVGFTTMAELRDPEQVKNLVDRCFERLAADVADFGGRVDKVVGDAILALFGAPVAHEDDAERAVRAGLRMQQTIEAWRAEVGVDGLQMRVGINTGEVLVGGLRAGGDWTAMGDVVNTASRLQTLAVPGTVVVGHDTYEATSANVRYTPLGELQAKGRTALVEAWVAEEALSPPGSRTRRLDVPMVGRGEERTIIDSLIAAAVRRRRAATVVVVGEAGMGKTRLAEEAAARAEVEYGAAVLEGACVPYGEANVWWPVADALRTSFGTPTGTAPADCRDLCTERVRAALPSASGEEVDRVAEGLLHLLGEPSALEGIDPGRARDEVTRSLVTYVEGWAGQRPVIVVLSDLHWADDAVLALGDALAERASGLPFVLLATARAGLLERWHPATERSNHVVLHLDPLSRDEASALLDELVCDVPEELRELVLDRSGGNPFFLEELASLLGEGGGRSGIPHTLRGLVAARLDALSHAEQAVIDDAAILGRKFPSMAIHLMAEKDADLTAAEVDRALADLVAKDLLSIEGNHYTFRSDLVREVAYDTLTKAARIKGHFGVAHWIEQHDTGSAADRDRMAHHYATAATLAGELGGVEGVPADLAARAVDALGRAVDAAARDELHIVVRRVATQALELADAAGLDTAARLRFELARSRSAVAQRDLDVAGADLDDAMAQAAAAGDPLLVAMVQAVQGDREQKRGDLVRSVELLEDATATFRGAGDLPRMAEALLTLGQSHIFAGNDDAAGEVFREALEAYRSLDDRRGEGWAIQSLAWVAFSAGRISEADQHCQESMAIFTELGDLGGLAWVQGILAYVRYHQGRYEEAEVLADRILVDAKDRADPWAIGMMLTLRASIRLWTGRSVDAIEPAEESVEKFRSMGDWYGQLMSLGTLGRSLVMQGRFDDGFAVIDDALRVAEGTPSSSAAQIAITQLVTSAAQAGRPDRVDDVDTSFARSHVSGEVGFTDCQVGDGLLHLQRGEAEAGRALLETVVDSLGESASGYSFSALALARAATGDVDGAYAAARAAGGFASTYSDRASAATAIALAAARAGDAEGAAAALGEVKEILGGTDDRHSRNLLSLAATTVDVALGKPVLPGAGAEAAAASPGWLVAYRLAAGIA
jgi:class 3 adenylate cyclase/tetratricopeptide (TPR) repeat protein